MSARAILSGAVIAAISASPGLAQSWGYGVEAGPPVYYEPYPAPPPGYYYEEPYYEEPPVVVVPAPPPVVRAYASPDDVLDMLEDQGFYDLSPMAERGDFYKLSAVNPEGDLVALEISVHTGEIERELILEAAAAPPAPRVVAVTPPPAPAPRVVVPSGPAPAPMLDRLQPVPAEPDGGDPLVIY